MIKSLFGHSFIIIILFSCPYPTKWCLHNMFSSSNYCHIVLRIRPIILRSTAYLTATLLGNTYVYGISSIVIIISLLMSPLLGHRLSLWIVHKENGHAGTVRIGGYPPSVCRNTSLGGITIMEYTLKNPLASSYDTIGKIGESVSILS
jgi:hypothetical protein